MHIVFLTHAFPINGKHTGGGAGNYVANMARILCRNGHKVTIITEADDENVFVWEGIEIHHIRATRFFKDTGRKMTTTQKVLKNLCRSIWYNHKVYKIEKKEKVDLVQAVSTFGIALFRCTRVPYLIRLSEHPVLWREATREDYNSKTAIKKEYLDDKLFFMALKRADKLVAPSYYMQDLIYERIRKNVTVIESPIISTDYKEDRFTPQTSYFLTFGTLNYRKCIHLLAQIIDKLLDEYTDMEYLLIGKNQETLKDGQYICNSELVISNVVRNRDRLIIRPEIFDRNELFSLIKGSAICILPSRADNLSNAWLEAMAFGKIIVSTEQSSAEQLITDGYNGFLAQMDNSEELYKKIKMAMELSDEEKKLMGNRAKERVKDLTPDKVYDKMLDAYIKTIENFNQNMRKGKEK